MSEAMTKVCWYCKEPFGPEGALLWVNPAPNAAGIHGAGCTEPAHAKCFAEANPEVAKALVVIDCKPAAISPAHQPDAEGELERFDDRAEHGMARVTNGPWTPYDQAAALIAAQARELAEAHAAIDANWVQHQRVVKAENELAEAWTRCKHAEHAEEVWQERAETAEKDLAEARAEPTTGPKGSHILVHKQFMEQMKERVAAAESALGVDQARLAACVELLSQARDYVASTRMDEEGELTASIDAALASSRPGGVE